MVHGFSSHVGRGVLGVGAGCGRVDGGVDGCLDGGPGDGVSSGNFGASNRYSSGSSFNAATAFSMNWRQIGAGPFAPKTS